MIPRDSENQLRLMTEAMGRNGWQLRENALVRLGPRWSRVEDSHTTSLTTGGSGVDS